MYSVVLLMALSGGAEAPDCHRSCHGCSGCSSSYCGGYCGGGCSSSCHGGGGLFGGHGCHGGGGLFGGHHRSSCHGCSGCYSCACSGCYGGGYGGGCYGGCYGGCAGCAGCAGYYPAGGGMMMEMKPGEKIKDMPKEKGKEEVSAPATIVLSLPADAQLTIDGAATTSASASRTFLTPELAPATDFVYTLSAKIVRNGETLTATEKVTVRAGEETRVNFATERFTALTVAAK
jgi:uncharacterized protein (TIGR03000 family)